jgi:hypothetical protein
MGHINSNIHSGRRTEQWWVQPFFVFFFRGGMRKESNVFEVEATCLVGTALTCTMGLAARTTLYRKV